MRVPKFPKLGLLWFKGPLILCAYLQLKWGLKQSCSLHWQLFNGMLHTTYAQRNQGDSQLLVGRNQIADLIPGPSFNYNLCFSCPNGSCEPISNIYVPRYVQWYKDFFNPMNLTPCNCPLKIRQFTKTLIPKMGVHLGVWRFIPSHAFALMGTWNMTLGLSLGSHLCKPFALVVSPRLRLQQLCKHHVSLLIDIIHHYNLLW